MMAVGAEMTRRDQEVLDQGSVLDYGRAKLARKGCELLVVNEVGANLTFGTDSNTVQVLFADGKPAVGAAGCKIEVARVVIEQLAAEINGHVADAK